MSESQQHPLPWNAAQSAPPSELFSVYDANGRVVILDTDNDTARMVAEGVNSTVDKRIEILVTEVKRLREENAHIVATAERDKEALTKEHDHFRQLHAAYKAGVLDCAATK